MKRVVIILMLFCGAAHAAGGADDPKMILGELNALAMAPDPSAKGKITAWLGHEDAGVRRAAIRALGYLGDPGVLPDLERFAVDSDPGFRVAYLFALMRLGDAGTMTAHAALAQDPDAKVRLAAQAGLTRFGLADHGAALRAVLAKRDLGEVAVAASGLVLAGGKENLAAVTALLTHGMDEIRGMGAQALGDAAPDGAILAALIQAHGRETYGYVSAALAQSIARLGGRDPALLARQLPSARHKGALVGTLRDRPEAGAVSEALVGLLGRPGVETLPVLEVLSHLDGETAAAALRGTAFDPAQPPALRAKTIRWLGDRGDRASRDGLRRALDDPAPEVRAEACYALSRLNDRVSAPRAVALLQDPSPHVVAAALAAIRNYRYLPAREQVGAMRGHPDPEIRRAAEEALEVIAEKEARLKQEIYRLGHDTILLRAQGRHIYFDPFQLPDGLPKAGVILITHDHHDHLCPEDIGKIADDHTVLVLPKAFAGKAAGLPGVHKTIAAGETVTVAGLELRAVPAYNPVKKFHPKAYGGVGYFVKVGPTTYYHAGDTDLIPEMRDFPPADVCFLPVSGTYVMTAGEAAEATKILKCGKAVPMHYGAIIGGDADAEEFKRSAACPVEILPLTASVP